MYQTKAGSPDTQSNKAMAFLQETVYCLEDRSRELKTELKIQKRKTKEIEDLRDSLTEQLLIFR